MKKIIHYYPRAFVGNGGVTIAVWQILRSLKKDYDLHIAYDQDLIQNQPLQIKNIKKIPTKHYLNGKFQIPSNFLKNFDKNTIVFLHSGLLLKNIFVALFAYKIGAKVILIPHGCYDPTLLNFNWFQKKLFILLEKFIFKNFFFFRLLLKKIKRIYQWFLTNIKSKLFLCLLKLKNQILKAAKKLFFLRGEI